LSPLQQTEQVAEMTKSCDRTKKVVNEMLLCQRFAMACFGPQTHSVARGAEEEKKKEKKPTYLPTYPFFEILCDFRVVFFMVFMRCRKI
jgi:hypothetical protein